MILSDNTTGKKIDVLEKVDVFKEMQIGVIRTHMHRFSARKKNLKIVVKWPHVKKKHLKPKINSNTNISIDFLKFENEQKTTKPMKNSSKFLCFCSYFTTKNVLPTKLLGISTLLK